MFGINDSEVRQLEETLRDVKSRALPFATRATINKAAFETQKRAKTNVREEMVTRNKFTEQGIQVVPDKRELQINRQQAVVGSISDYMESQEFGDVKAKKGKHGVAIPTSEASGEGRGVMPRKKLVRKANKLNTLVINKGRRRPKTKKQRNLFKVQDAVTTGRRYVFLELGRRKGIFKVIGGRKKFKRGWPKGARIKMMYDLTEVSVTIPRNPWLAPATQETVPEMADYYRAALTFQLRRLGAR